MTVIGGGAGGGFHCFCFFSAAVGFEEVDVVEGPGEPLFLFAVKEFLGLVLEILLVPIWTRAGFPFETTVVTELGAADTSGRFS